MGIRCDDCGAEAKWTERECPSCGRPFADQESSLLKKVHSRVHKLSDILIEDPSLFRKSGLQLKGAWDNYDPDEISKVKSTSRKRTLYVSSIYVILAFFLFAALLMLSAPLLGEPSGENAEPEAAEVNDESEAVEAAEGDSNSDEGTDSDWDTDSDGSNTPDLDDDVTLLDDLDDELRESGIQVEYLDGAEDPIWLDYVTAANPDEQMREEVETVAVAYANLVNSRSSYGSNMIHVIFMDAYGNDLGGFFVMNEWAKQYAEGEISLEEYIELIITETFGYE